MTEINYYIVLLVSPSCLLPLASTLSFAVRLFRGEEKDKQSESKSYFRNLSRISFFFSTEQGMIDFSILQEFFLSLSLFVYKKAKKSTPMKAYCEKCINVIRESRWKEKRGERLCRKIGNIEGEGG